MKKMTCRQLGGACDKEFYAKSFDEIGELSKKHGTKMYQTGEKNHINAMNEMMKLMKSQKAMADWFSKKRKEFESLPEIE